MQHSLHSPDIVYHIILCKYQKPTEAEKKHCSHRANVKFKEEKNTLKSALFKIYVMIIIWNPPNKKLNDSGQDRTGDLLRVKQM